MYPGKMNLPTQSICRPSDAASCFPIETRSILSPLITTVAFGSTLLSAGLITVAPTSAVFSPRLVRLNPNKMIGRTVLDFICKSLPASTGTGKFPRNDRGYWHLHCCGGVVAIGIEFKMPGSSVSLQHRCDPEDNLSRYFFLPQMEENRENWH